TRPPRPRSARRWGPAARPAPPRCAAWSIPRAARPPCPPCPGAARRGGATVRRSGRGSCVSPAQQDSGQAQGERGVSAQYGETGPRRQRVVTGRRRVEGGDLRVLRRGLLEGERGGRG